MKSLKIQLLVGIVVLAGIAAAVFVIRKGGQKAGDLRKDFSYTLGMQYAQNIKKQNVDIDTDQFVAGATDILAGRKSRLTEEEMQKTLQDWQRQFDSQNVDKAKENRAAGEAFVTKYRAESGVKASKSGVQYKVLKEGSGATPKETDLVTVKYTGKLIDGTLFDTTEALASPPEMPIKNLIPGWLEILPMMKAGAKWEVVIPSQLGYGDSVHPKIPPGSTIIFEIEMVSFKHAEKK